jgi:SNF2 family DNA or RNA helicase
MQKELHIIISQESRLLTEFSDTTLKLSKSVVDIQNQFEESFKECFEKALFNLGFVEAKGHLSSTLNFWHEFSAHYVKALRLTENLEILREKAKIVFDKDFAGNLVSDAPFFAGSEYLNIDFMRIVWEKLTLFFKTEIKNYKGTVKDFFKGYSSQVNLADKIYFHLVENQKGASTPFIFLATYSADVAENGNSRHRPLRNLLTEYADKQDKLVELLSTVYKVAEKSPFIKTILDSGEIFYPLGIDSTDSFMFLKETEIYEEHGILCRIPNWWKRASKGISLSLNLGDKRKALLGLSSLIDFDMKFSIAGSELTEKEVRRILEESSGLTLIKGKWVAVDKEKLRATLEKWEELKELVVDEKMTLSEALRFAAGLNDNILKKDSDISLDIGFGKWMKTIFEKMLYPSKLEKIHMLKDFKTELRHYQQDGINWLSFLGSMNLGACLADDMGLGKTVQVIALLNSLKKKKGYSTSLLAVPASLIHNWASEIKKFAPKLKFSIAHPSGGEEFIGKDPDIEKIKKYDLIITTYGLAKKYEWMKSHVWKYFIIDEAQAIKNPMTTQTKGIKSIPSEKRIALTGTPIENSLVDLWSIFDFLNPGLMGNKEEFKKLTKEGEHSFGKIRKIIDPYILRRLKTDKSIIFDLPDKIELDSYSQLTKKQLVLYQNQVDHLKKAIEDSEGIERKGLVLATLMRFKQICNHPSQYLGDNDFNEKDSGKFNRLKEICETVKEKRERMLIFTQFKEMTEPLNKYLHKTFGKPGFVLHGGTQIKKRREMVNKFQSDEYYPYFVLSLKAGGTGLNLTKANHVVHFDRWWNPAVENQATDRVFRIGQKKSVLVHKFICEGTFEEKIDEMLKSKSKLSKSILSKTEGVKFTEMNNDEIIKMFSIGV